MIGTTAISTVARMNEATCGIKDEVSPRMFLCSSGPRFQHTRFPTPFARSSHLMANPDFWTPKTSTGAPYQWACSLGRKPSVKPTRRTINCKVENEVSDMPKPHLQPHWFLQYLVDQRGGARRSTSSDYSCCAEQRRADRFGRRMRRLGPRSLDLRLFHPARSSCTRACAHASMLRLLLGKPATT